MDTERRSDLLDQYERVTEIPLLVLALLMVPLLLAPLLIDLSSIADTAVESSFWAIWVMFAADLGIRTYLSTRRISYLVSHWYDLLIVAIPFLRPLRVLRSARALRLLRLSRVAPFLTSSAANIREVGHRRGLQWVLLFGVAAIFASAALVYEFERSTGGPIDDFGTALWWAMSTVTTVGYGDATPVTAEGRGVAIFLMLVGISFASWVTANVAAFLVESSAEPDAVSLADVMRKLEMLEEELKSLKNAVSASS